MTGPRDDARKPGPARMTSPDDDAPSRAPGGRNAATGGRAFDLWLNRGLHAIFDDIASEPVPDDLLRLIEEDRTKGGGESTDG